MSYGSNITIGGTTAAAGNLVSGNTGNGIQLDYSPGDLIEGNLVGTDAAGGSALPNGGDGVNVSESMMTTIGGTAAGAGNVLSGNNEGLFLFGTITTDSVVEGTLIGTNASGTAAIANDGDGIVLNNLGPGNTIGGTSAGARNVISGNLADGIQFAAASGETVIGNFIGTDITGKLAIGNAGVGVRLAFITPDNTIGGTAAGTGNLISGNEVGVNIELASDQLVIGNRIGTDVTGTKAIGNTIGVDIDQSSSISIGGASAGAGNLVSGNTSYGILVYGSSATGNVVAGNRIGTNADGTAALGNFDGVNVEWSGNTIGGTTAGEGISSRATPKRASTSTCPAVPATWSPATGSAPTPPARPLSPTASASSLAGRATRWAG